MQVSWFQNILQKIYDYKFYNAPFQNYLLLE